MSRLFDDSASDRAVNTSSVPVTAVPLSMSCWFYDDDGTLDSALMMTRTSATENNRFMLGVTASSSNRVRVKAQLGGTEGQAVTSPGQAYSTNTWVHAGAVFTSATSRDAFINGGNKASNITDVTPTSQAQMWVGAAAAGVEHFSGRIAEAAVWNVALSDAEMTILGLGVSPLFVRTNALVAYWPLVGRASPETDYVGGIDLTLTGTANADHPRVIQKAGIGHNSFAVAVASGNHRPLLLSGVGF